jgi:hypothetical protein
VTGAAVPQETPADAARDPLMAELEVLRARLRAHAGSDVAGGAVTAAEAELARVRARSGASALDEVATGFGLSRFERSVLLLAAGPELVGAVADELEAAHGAPHPTFGLALQLLPDAHWSALPPEAPLRRWRLVRMAEVASPTRGALIADEHVLHHLLGVPSLAAELAAVSRRLPAPGALPPTLRTAAEGVCRAWSARLTPALHGPQPANFAAVAATAAAEAGLALHLLAVGDLPVEALPRDRILRLLERDAVLGRTAWAVDVDGRPADEVRSALRALTSLDAPLVLIGVGEGDASAAEVSAVHVARLSTVEREAALRCALQRQAPGIDAGISAAAGVFDLSLPDLDLAAREVSRGVGLWDACRARSRSRLAGSAQVLAPRAGWHDLVLPESRLEQLRSLVATVRHRTCVLGEWGFDQRSARGLGTAALFAGPSGTGKTLAAEVVAGELGLDLVVVDLSRVVSKYIGETEKNLGRVFDAAEDGAAVLLFDEADALFGKRTEVRDSHDRYANLEVGYLLQRIEQFRGLAVLTTNVRSALDPAFLRRLRTVVTFPYPDKAAREALWRRAFPPATPLADVDPIRLSGMDLSGGGVAAAALTAAYLAADEGVVTGEHVETAARWELAKSGRTLSR